MNNFDNGLGLGFGGFMFGVFPFIFFIMFFGIMGLFVFTIINNVKRYHKNNNSPVLTVVATVVSKRTDVTHHHHNNASSTSHMSSSTWYYTTFQVESGDRMELGLNGSEYGMLAEGDVGRLTFQGTRYKGFERNSTTNF